MVLLTMAFLFFAGFQASAAQQASSSPDSEMIHIDGKKNPELIPQWKAWEAAFELLAAGKRAGGQVLDEELQLSVADKALVYAEAARNQERWNAHKSRVLNELEPLLRTTKREDLLPKNRALILDYRQQVLDGSQRLLQRLSPEGRAWLPLWVEQLKHVVTLTIPKSELDFYRRPY